MANKKLVDLLLQDENANVANEEFETLSGSDWVRLLSKKPQFADKCEWHKLTGKQWSDLLLKQPQFVIKCDLNKIEPYFYQLSDKYKDIGCYIEINELPPKFIARLLAEAPQFAEKCNQWNNFSSFDWSVLLSKQPQFADKCDKWDDFYENDWSCLLAKQPQFADKCDWDKLDGSYWGYLLSERPQFADKCDKWDEFYGNDWSCLLAKQPQFADKCDWDKLDGSAWGYLLSERPQFADKCDVWDYLDAALWESLLKHQPQLVDKCAKSSIVVNVLIKHPQFTEHCNTSIITEKGKAKLLAKHPDLVKYFPEKTETKVPKKKQIKNKSVALLPELF